MRIAIIGTGFCGLAAAWHLLQQSQEIQVALFDSQEIGKKASGIAAGLLHPYAGAHAKRSWRADEGMLASMELFQAAEKALGQPILFQPGLLRLALTPSQMSDYSICQKRYPDEVRWLSALECEKAVKGILPSPGIFIGRGMVVDCQRYLQGLWKSVSEKGARLIQESIASLMDLKEFDAVIAAMGASATDLPELRHLPVHPVKGHLLEFEWPEELPALPFPINSQAYLLMNPQNSATCIAGATFEKNCSSLEVDEEKALNEIYPKIHAFFPSLKKSALVGCRAAIRAVTANRRPLLTRATKNCWVLTGMGSKGLLYHALYAKELAADLLKTFNFLTLPNESCKMNLPTYSGGVK
jgi:glycine/D-amino acid oxidase-like deaminating enzyme